jgi:general stress protein 26
VGDAAIERLNGLLEVGAAIMVATRDEDNRPHATRGWGGRLDASAEHLDLYITVSDDLHVVADLEANGAVAVTLVRPTNYLAMQVTGYVEWIGDVTATDRERIDAYITLFVDEVVTIGMPASSGLLAGDRYMMIRIALQDFFEQTPGEKAGSTL